MAAGTLVEMPFENLSNGAALWVDVVYSKERPLGPGGAAPVLMNDNQALETELAFDESPIGLTLTSHAALELLFLIALRNFRAIG